MKIYIHQHNIDHITNDTEFNEHLTNVLDLHRGGYSPELGDTGEYVSTSRDDSVLLKIDNRRHIIKWLLKVVADYCSKRGTEIDELQVRRCWCNRTHRNTKIAPHIHLNSPYTKKVAILYYEAPENSSKFVIIDSKEQLNSYDSYDENLLQFVEVNPGMAIMHDADVMHAVTEHNSDKHRTVFVFDIMLTEKIV